MCRLFNLSGARHAGDARSKFVQTLIRLVGYANMQILLILSAPHLHTHTHRDIMYLLVLFCGGVICVHKQSLHGHWHIDVANLFLRIKNKPFKVSFVNCISMLLHFCEPMTTARKCEIFKLLLCVSCVFYRFSCIELPRSGAL